MTLLTAIEGSGKFVSDHGAARYVYKNRPVLLASVILLMTSLLAAAAFAEPLWAGVFFIFSSVIVLFFLKLKMAILLTIFFFIVLYRVIFQVQSTTKLFVEVFQIGSYIGIVAAYLIWVLRRLSGLEKRDAANYLDTAVILFIIWGVFSLFWTEDISHGFVLCISMLINLLIIKLFSILFKGKKDVDRFMVFIAIAGFLLGLITFFSKWYLYEYSHDIPGTDLTFIAALGGDNFGPNPEVIRAAGYATANQVAFILNIFLFIILSKVFEAKLFKDRLKYIALFLFLSGCIVFTGSKGAILSLVFGIYLILAMNTIIRMKRIIWFVVLTGLLMTSIFLVFALGEGRIVKSVKGGKSSELAYTSFSSRIDAWKNGFKDFDIPSKILFGYGLGSSAARAKILPNMHSFYFSAMFDMGLIGLTLYLSILLVIVKKLYESIMSVQSIDLKNILFCLAGALAASMINGLVMAEFSFHFFWILLAIIVAFTKKALLLLYMEDSVTLIS